MARAAVLLAEGFEEIEAVTIVDVLRRADIDTVIVGVTGNLVEGAHGIAMRADRSIEKAALESWDLIVLPGGMPGATTLRDDPRVIGWIRDQNARGGRVAAICAAPIALSKAGVLSGRRATSYPGFGDQVAAASYVEEAVVVDGTVTTSRGPGTAMAFALSLVEQVLGAPKKKELADAMLVR